MGGVEDRVDVSGGVAVYLDSLRVYGGVWGCEGGSKVFSLFGEKVESSRNLARESGGGWSCVSKNNGSHRGTAFSETAR